jgi:hypothetical protein
MPSLHFATSLMAALLLAESWPPRARAGPTPGRSASLSSIGEHYLVDLLVGAAIVIAVRRGERYVEPVAMAVSRGLQRLERIANE